MSVFKIGTISFFASFVLFCTLFFFGFVRALLYIQYTIERTSILSSTLLGCEAKNRIRDYSIARPKNFQFSLRFIEIKTACISAGPQIVETVNFAKIQQGLIVPTLPCPQAQPRGPIPLQLPKAGEAGGWHDVGQCSCYFSAWKLETCTSKTPAQNSRLLGSFMSRNTLVDSSEWMLRPVYWKILEGAHAFLLSSFLAPHPLASIFSPAVILGRTACWCASRYLFRQTGVHKCGSYTFVSGRRVIVTQTSEEAGLRELWRIFSSNKSVPAKMKTL